MWFDYGLLFGKTLSGNAVRALLMENSPKEIGLSSACHEGVFKLNARPVVSRCPPGGRRMRAHAFGGESGLRQASVLTDPTA